MFSGLVQTQGAVLEMVSRPSGQRLVVRADGWGGDIAEGESIAVNGCCLTVVDRPAQALAFDVGPETLRCTNLGGLQAGDGVNLERSLRAGDLLGGHFVTGHVDGLGTVERWIPQDEFVMCWFRVAPPLMRHVAPKGSVAVDGVSLTVVDVEPDRFSVMLIPHTLAVTTLGRLAAGGRVNIETDILAKYVERQLAQRNDA
jgi:riboflavin synthase